MTELQHCKQQNLEKWLIFKGAQVILKFIFYISVYFLY